MSDFPVTVFHNPRCGTSRNTVAMIEAAGYSPEVVEYVEAGWTRELLQELLAALGKRPADILRRKEPMVAELGLTDASDEALLDAMLAHPILVERPIVRTPKGVVLARPSEVVFDVLERRPESFTKEDGQVV